MIDSFLNWASTFQGEQTIAMFVAGLVFLYVYLFWMNFLANRSDVE